MSDDFFFNISMCWNSFELISIFIQYIIIIIRLEKDSNIESSATTRSNKFTEQKNFNGPFNFLSLTTYFSFSKIIEKNNKIKENSHEFFWCSFFRFFSPIYFFFYFYLFFLLSVIREPFILFFTYIFFFCNQK